MDTLPKDIEERFLIVVAYIGTQTNEWMVIKDHLAKTLSNEKKKLFSNRHGIWQNKQIINSFDKLVMDWWEKQTGILPVIPSNRLWVPKKNNRIFKWNIVDGIYYLNPNFISKPRKKKKTAKKNEK